jgi:hypothetical protein
MSAFNEWNVTREYSAHLDRLKNIKPYYSIENNHKRVKKIQRNKERNRNLSLSISSKKT